MAVNAPKGKKEPNQGEVGFFKRFFSGTYRTQRKTIRTLKKELSHAKIDLYKIKHDLVQPGIARILFEIYKLTYPFRQTFTFDVTTKRFLPSFDESFISFFHSEAAAQIYEKITEENIRKLVEKHGVRKTSAYIDKLMRDFLDYFDAEKIKEINAVYTNLLGFAQFTKFDLYPILREFDTRLEEGNFVKKPSFGGAEGSFLRNDFYKLHKTLYAFEVDERLDKGLEILSRIRNADFISKGNWNRLKNLIGTLQKNNYLALLIRSIDRSLSPILIERPFLVNVFQAFSHKRKNDVQSILSSIKNKIKEDSVSSISRELFHENPTQRIKNYTDSKNDQFKNLSLPVFEYVTPLNYVKAFLTDKYKDAIDQVVNELIVSGIFINKEILTDLSNSYYELNNQLQKIVDFDTEMDSEGSSARTIKRFLYTIKKDQNSRAILEKSINGINTRAKLLIDEQVLNLKLLALCLKNVLEDYKRKNPVIVSNIRKIRMNFNKQFVEELLAAYKNSYLFLKLIGNYVTLNVSRSEVEKQKLLTME
jgi:hypothetical protein